MDTRVESEDGFAPIAREPEHMSRVSLSRLDPCGPTEPSRQESRTAVTMEEYEIGIGAWKATILKQVDGKAGRSRFRARFEQPPREAWNRRRLQRVVDRLNARRRSSD